MVKLAVSDRLSLKANASFARHRYAFDYISRGVYLNGKDIDTAPRHFGSMQLVWKPVDGLKTELEWIHMGAYYTDPENRHKYEGHDYLNLRVAYQITDRYGLFLRVMNLTDTRYAERADYTTFTDERYFPGKPRSLYMGVQTKF